MSLANEGFLPLEPHNLGLSRNLGDALMVIAKRVWPYHTAKNIEAEWGCDKSTAKNVTKGVVGAAVVTRALRAQQDKHKNGWALWDALGELIIGETRAEYEQRVIKTIIRENERAREALETSRGRFADLEARASGLVDLGSRLAAGERRTFRG